MRFGSSTGKSGTRRGRRVCRRRDRRFVREHQKGAALRASRIVFVLLIEQFLRAHGRQISPVEIGTLRLGATTDSPGRAGFDMAIDSLKLEKRKQQQQKAADPLGNEASALHMQHGPQGLKPRSRLTLRRS